MEPKLREKLKLLANDDNSFKELEEIVSDIIERKNRFKSNLSLLERVTENDYDSILITTLGLEKPAPKIVYVNDGFTAITGYDREEVIGKTPRILQGPKTKQATLDKLKRRLKNGQPFFGQAVNYKKDGSEFINQWDIHPLADKNGNVTHWVSYQHDITERKRAEQMIMNTHTEFDELRESSKSTILDVETDGTIISANKSFRNLTGYEKDELKGKKVWELFPRKYRNSLKTRFDKKFDKNDFKNQQLKGIIKHKKGLPIQVKGTTSILDVKNCTVIRSEINNISLQKRIMEALEKRNKDYGKIVDKTTQFTYRVSMQGGNPIIEYVSDEFPKVTGLSADKIMQSGGLEDFIHKNDLQKVRDCLNSAAEGRSCTCEYRIRTRDDSYQKVIDYCKPSDIKKDESKPRVCGAISFLPEQEPA